jgi:hypothetical protein
MSEMTEAQREKLATYYSTRSTVDGMSAGEWVNEPAADPMVTTSLRLPVHLMQTVRAMAASEGVKPTALIRRWVEDAVSGRSGWEPSKDDLERLTAKVDQMLGLLGNVVSLNAIKARRAEPKPATHPTAARTTSRKPTTLTTAARTGKTAAPGKKTASTKTAAKTAVTKTAAKAAPARPAARSGVARAEASTRAGRGSSQRADSSRSGSR